MISDQHFLKGTEKPTKGDSFFAEVLKEVDMQLYGAAYGHMLSKAEMPKVDTEATVADAKTLKGFPPANVVGGENGYIDFGASVDEVGQKRNANADKLLNFVDNKLAA